MTLPLKYLEGYDPDLQARVRGLMEQGRLEGYLRDRYGEAHDARTDKTLFEEAMKLKQRYLRSAPPLHKVVYDKQLDVLGDALGTHTRISRVQGARLKASREIRIAAVFRDAPAAFLKMILVHELAHLRERDHGKAFYQLCTHMTPDYHQLEFDLRVYLTMLETQ